MNLNFPSTYYWASNNHCAPLTVEVLWWGVAVDLGFTTLLTSLVISDALYSEREKSEKFCSEALISAWGSFTCRKSTTRDPRLYFPSEVSHTQYFYALKISIDPGRVWTRTVVSSDVACASVIPRMNERNDKNTCISVVFLTEILLSISETSCLK